MVARLRQVDTQYDWSTSRLVHMERGNVKRPEIRHMRLLAIVLGVEIGDLVWPREARGNGPDTIQHFAAASDLHLIAA